MAREKPSESSSCSPRTTKAEVVFAFFTESQRARGGFDLLRTLGENWDFSYANTGDELVNSLRGQNVVAIIINTTESTEELFNTLQRQEVRVFHGTKLAIVRSARPDLLLRLAQREVIGVTEGSSFHRMLNILLTFCFPSKPRVRDVSQYITMLQKTSTTLSPGPRDISSILQLSRAAGVLEHRYFTIRCEMPKGLTTGEVFQLSKEMRKKCKVTVADGQLSLGGELLTIGTADRRPESRNNRAIFILSKDGDLYVGQEIDEFYHASFGKKSIASAGELEAKDGRLVWISGASHIDIFFLLQARAFFASAGCGDFRTLTAEELENWEEELEQGPHPKKRKCD